MSKIFCTGRPPIEVSQDEAIRINEMWIASRPKGKEHLIPEVLEAGGQTFLSKDIKGFEFIDFASKQAEAMEYNVAVNGFEKDKVRAFEGEFDVWKSQHPQFTEWQKYHFLEEKGLIKMGANRQLDIVLTAGDKEKHKQYLEYLKLFSSLDTLKFYREKAQAHNDPDFEAKRIAMFKRMKSGLRFGTEKAAEIKSDEQENLRVIEMAETNRIREMKGLSPRPNPQLAQLKADEQEFNQQHGIDEYNDIKPESIPF